jgi:hypothetical protein
MRACCSAKSEHVHLTRMVLLALPFGQNSEERSLQPSMCTTRWNRRSCLVSKLLIFLCTVRFRSNVWLMKAKRHWLVDAAESLTLTTRYSTYKPPCRVVCKQLPALYFCFWLEAVLQLNARQTCRLLNSDELLYQDHAICSECIYFFLVLLCLVHTVYKKNSCRWIRAELLGVAATAAFTD